MTTKSKTSRRTLIAALAAVTVAGVPMIASAEPDPIFALIESAKPSRPERNRRAKFTNT